MEGIQALDGLFLAARRSLPRAVGFDQARFDGFHLYDLDFSFSAYLAGYRLAVCNDITIAHHSHGRYDRDWRKYANLFLAKHGARLAKSPGVAVRYPRARLPTREQAYRFCQGMARFMERVGWQ